MQVQQGAGSYYTPLQEMARLNGMQKEAESNIDTVAAARIQMQEVLSGYRHSGDFASFPAIEGHTQYGKGSERTLNGAVGFSVAYLRDWRIIDLKKRDRNFSANENTRAVWKQTNISKGRITTFPERINVTTGRFVIGARGQKFFADINRVVVAHFHTRTTASGLVPSFISTSSSTETGCVIFT
ncbi:hypothetical protein BD410DRAFT_833229 [Rickenella mellea]|uniref:Uncharacterized protein n=1 Tax=Rickenella mellea TaxID=50990 RepID=A0A4Y7PHE9_9AGAM|nr:hypothetical protein BD410DRAFT_833229 [Rickenella mellea]